MISWLCLELDSGNDAFYGCSGIESLEIARLYNTSTSGNDALLNHFVGIVGSNIKTITLYLFSNPFNKRYNC